MKKPKKKKRDPLDELPPELWSTADEFLIDDWQLPKETKGTLIDSPTLLVVLPDQSVQHLIIGVKLTKELQGHVTRVLKVGGTVEYVEVLGREKPNKSSPRTPRIVETPEQAAKRHKANLKRWAAKKKARYESRLDTT